MLDIFLIILSLVGLLIVAVILFAASRPDEFRIERSIEINATPERIRPLLDDFHAWAAWSPWEKLDADLKRSYSGPQSGVGAIYGWSGKKAGDGRMEILDATNALVLIKLDFHKPFKAENQAVFTLSPHGLATTVQWAMTGKSPLISKVMSLVFNMDKMVGGSFEQGLADLKKAAETQAV
jgi:hypothetical protein